jgi:bifunctional non-homologous end joining protein LigD
VAKSSAKSAIPAGAVRASFPGFLEFCGPTLNETAPRGQDWAHEIKADGYRVQVHLVHGNVAVYTRRGHDWTDQFRAIAASAVRLNARQAVLDGEAVVLAANGVADFHALRRELGKRSSDRLVYQAFDLLYLDGYDLRPAPYLERKAALRALLTGAPAGLSYVDYLEGDGETIFAHACAIGIEGIVSKRKDAPYLEGRQTTWIKLKCVKSEDFPIIAFVEKLGANPRRIASLYVGRQESGRLLYGGKLQTGFTEPVMREIRERLDPLITSRCPLDEPLKKPKATWVEPVVRAEVQYGGVTEDGILREAVFKGLRDDLMGTPPPTTAVRRRRDTVHGVPRENILQLLLGAPIPSEEQLTAYWRRVWRKALKYLGRRPLKLVRHMHGVVFYHKGPLPPVPGTVHRLTVQKREGGEGTRLWVDDLDGLLGLVSMGVIEVHPWNSTVDDLEHPDVLVFDLDPGEGIDWEFVIKTALRLRELLKAEGLRKAWPKLSGGKGVHVMVPIDRTMAHDDAHAYCRRLAQQLTKSDPGRYTLSAAPEKRSGRLFIDYLRNGRGTTAIGAYSPRARPGFPVAMPTTWKALKDGIDPDCFSILSRRTP